MVRNQDNITGIIISPKYNNTTLISLMLAYLTQIFVNEVLQRGKSHCPSYFQEVKTMARVQKKMTAMFWSRVISLFLRTFRVLAQIGKYLQVLSPLLTLVVSSLVYLHNTIKLIPPTSSLYRANIVPSDYPPLTKPFHIHSRSSPVSHCTEKTLRKFVDIFKKT